MILPDYEIRQMILDRNLITPFNPEQLNPASYDVRLANIIILEDGVKQVFTAEYLLKPKEFILAGTMETFNLPNDICGQFALKSSMARKGLSHNMAGFCDPGWNSSVLTMELCNMTQNTNIELVPGMRIGQMVFMRLNSSCEVGYDQTGKYNNDSTVMAAKEKRLGP